MPALIPTTTTTYTVDANGSYEILLEGETIITTSGEGLNFLANATGAEVYVNGLIAGETVGILATQSTTSANDGNSIFVGASGEVMGTSGGIQVGSDNAKVVNAGVIQAFDGIGIFNLNSAENFSVTNSGTISGTLIGAEVRSTDWELLNTGLISGEDGVLASGNGGLLINSGTIAGGADGYGVLISTLEGETVEIFNSGLISGGINSIVGGFEDETVRNSGTLLGDVELYFGDDILRIWGDGQVVGDIDMGVGNDTVFGSRFDDVIYGGSVFFLGDDDDVLRGRDGDDEIYGGREQDALFGGNGDDQLFGEDDNDQISGGNGADTVDGGDGFDVLKGNNGDDVIFGGGGKDTISGGSGDDVIDGGNADDIVKGNAGNDKILGDKGLDTLWGNDGDDTLDGGDQNDVIYGGRDNDTLIGGAAKDDLFGGSGDDILMGDGGDDTLSGGKGDDTLTGGSGSDVFVFGRHTGNDVVTDFEDNVDAIDLSAFNFGSTGAATAIASDIDGGVLFDLALAGGSGSIYIEGITKADINGSDLIL